MGELRHQGFGPSASHGCLHQQHVLSVGPNPDSTQHGSCPNWMFDYLLAYLCTYFCVSEWKKVLGTMQESTRARPPTSCACGVMLRHVFHTLKPAALLEPCLLDLQALDCASQ